MRVALAALVLLLSLSAATPAEDKPAAQESPVAAKVRSLVENGFAGPMLSDRSSASEAIKTLGPEAAGHLEAYLEDSRYQVRLWAVMTLGEVGGTHSVPKLLRVARESAQTDFEFHTALTKALARILAGARDYRVDPREFDSLPEHARGIVFQAAGMAPVRDIVTRLAANIDSKGDSGSYQGQFKSLRLLGDFVVFALLEILGPGRGPVPREYLPEDLAYRATDEVWMKTLRWLCLLALGELGDPSALPKLRSCFKDFFEEDDLTMSRASAYSCWLLGDPGPVGLFLEKMKRRPSFSPWGGGIESDISHYFNLGYTYNMIGKVAEAMENYRKCVNLHKSATGLQTNGGIVAQYNIACLYAVKRNLRAGLHALRQAVELGYSDERWVLLDGDLDYLRHDPRFELILARMHLRSASRMTRGPGWTVMLDMAMDRITEAVDRGLSPEHWIWAERGFANIRSADGYAFEDGRMTARALAPVRFAAFKGF